MVQPIVTIPPQCWIKEVRKVQRDNTQIWIIQENPIHPKKKLFDSHQNSFLPREHSTDRYHGNNDVVMTRNAMRDNTVTPFYRQSGNSDRNINRQTNQPIGNNSKPHYVSNDHQHDKGNGRNYKVAREFNIVTQHMIPTTTQRRRKGARNIITEEYRLLRQHKRLPKFCQLITNKGIHNLSLKTAVVLRPDRPSTCNRPSIHHGDRLALHDLESHGLLEDGMRYYLLPRGFKGVLPTRGNRHLHQHLRQHWES